MKKIIIVLMLAMSLTMSAQETYDPYVSLSLSISDEGSFDKASYPAVEVGVCRKNIALAAAVGRGSLHNIFRGDDVLGNYFWEAKVAPYYDLGSFRGSVFAGYGSYFDSKHDFTDVGLGVSYTAGDFSYGVAFNRWDKVNYVSPSITYNL